MLKIFKYLFITIIFLTTNLISAENLNYNKGMKFYEEKDYDNAKINFEKVIVYDPKNEKSYLYLAKIFKKKEKKELEKNNLDTVLLLNPKNEEATYRLAELYIVQSDFLKSKNLIKKLKKICNKFCTSINKLEEKLVAASKK